MFPPSCHHCSAWFRLDPEQRFELWDFDPLCAAAGLIKQQHAMRRLVLHLQQPLMRIQTLRTQTQRGRSTWLTGPWEHTYLEVPSETFWFKFHHNVSGEMLRLAFSAGDVSNLSLCRHIVIYVFSHEAKSTLGDSLLHLKPITVK